MSQLELPGLSDITVLETSPDKTVQARMRLEDGPRIRLKPECLAGHTERSLAGQTVAALKAAMTAYRDACDAHLDDTSECDSPLSEKIESTMDISAVGESPRGWAMVRRHGEGRFELGLRPGMVTRLSVEAVVSEINGALSTATAALGKEWLARFQASFPRGRMTPGGSS